MGKNSVTQKLDEALGIAKTLLDESDTNEIVLSPERPPALRTPQYDTDLENDYRDTRDTLKSLVTKAELALDGLLEIAKESEHPRTYEVASTLIKTISEVTKELMSLQKTMRDLKTEQSKKDSGGNMTVEKADNVTNQTIVFNGTTKELQEMLKQARLGNVVDNVIDSDG